MGNIDLLTGSLRFKYFRKRAWILNSLILGRKLPFKML
jgi:hypothetical protein